MIACSEPAAKEGPRDRLRLLDACLDDLERGHEREESTVSAELESRLREHVPQVRAGMPISKAMGLVFREQERCLLKRGLAGRAGIDRQGRRPVAGVVALARREVTPRPASAGPDGLDLDRLGSIIRQTREMIRY